MKTNRTQQEMSHYSFLKLGLAVLSASALLFVSGCLGEEDEDGGDEDD